MKAIYNSTVSVLLLGLMALAASVSCSKNGPSSNPEIKLPEGVVELQGPRNSRETIIVESTESWSVDFDASWLGVFPMSGNPGKTEVMLMSKLSNVSGQEQECTLEFRSASAVNSLVVRQLPAEVLLLDKTDYRISQKGEQLHIPFKTNVEGRLVLYTYTENVKDWIKPVKDANVKSLESFEYVLEVLENPTHDERSAEFYIEVVDSEFNTLISSELITITQDGIPVDTSVDYSSDRKVELLQSHSLGAGVPIVLMGDGFADVDIDSGYYRSVMENAMENLFSEQPVKGLRDYFDVWMVTAVSKHNAFGSDYSTVFSCSLPTDGSSRITGDENKVMEYVYEVRELASIEKVSQTLAIVILNSNRYAGTTGFGYSGLGEFGLVFCPVVDGLGSERFRSVLVHEAIGHGFAKLYDEYAYESYGTISPSVYNQVLSLQSEYGWAKNVSLTSSRTEVPWARLLSDERYSTPDCYGEVLGVYEGACTYWKGAWRPTDDSMMRTNQHGFNPPSREAIYKRAMTVAFGSEWEYDYESFVSFDLSHLPEPQSKACGVSNETSDFVDFSTLPLPEFGKELDMNIVLP